MRDEGGRRKMGGKGIKDNGRTKSNGRIKNNNSNMSSNSIKGNNSIGYIKGMQIQKFKRLLKEKKGESTPLTVAVILVILMLICTVSEWFRITVIAGGVRDSLQQSVISLATTNYDEVYNGLREGYSGGYVLYGNTWYENLDYDEVYAYLDYHLGLAEQGEKHQKLNGSSYEYQLSGLTVSICNTPLAPGNVNRNLEAVASVDLEVPLSFGWERLPPLKLRIQTKASYMPKF